MPETTIETKSCKHCQASFDITDKDMEFYDKLSPTFAGTKYQIPTPTLCSDCRQQRVLNYRNERNLYRRTCDASQANIISMYSPDSSANSVGKPFKVYEQKARWGDTWNPLDYGRDFDFSKTFSQQFEDLMKQVPLINLIIGGSENCDYTNFTRSNKSSYLLFASDYNENCFFSSNIFHSKDVLDNMFVTKAENSYECIDSENIYKCFRVQNCKESNNCYFCSDCVSCSNCIGCTNLRNQSYHYFNKPIPKSEYEEILAGLSNNIDGMKKKFEVFKGEQIRTFANIINSENSTGDYIFNSKNCTNCYDIIEGEDCKNSSLGVKCKDCYDSVGVPNSKLIYQSTGIPEDNNIICSACIRPSSSNLLYCYSCVQSNNCFACVSIKNNEYCILNKQYTKAEYEDLVPKIIEKMKADGERGESLSPHISPFGYNETLAMEYFPLTKDEAIKQGFKRSDYEAPFPKTDAKDVIICEVSGKPFRLIPQEIEFYKKHNLPSPTKHPDVRHAQRMALRNPRKLRNRKCNKCGIDIKTTYSPERKEIIYCDACYNKEIYG